MAEIHKKIISILDANGIDYKDNDSKLAKAILQLIQSEANNSVQNMKDLVFIPAKMKEGCICPMCNQNVKMYRRTITSTMAIQLIKLHNINKTDYVHYGIINDGTTAGGGDFAKLLYWGMILQKPKGEGDEGKKDSGYWKITSAGINFVNKVTKVSKYAKVYNNHFYGHEGDMIGIDDALGNKFNYAELMKR